LATRSETLAQVNADIARVRDARAKGLALLDGKLLGGFGTQASADAIRALPIDAWAARGLAAANAGAPPAGRGWPGWTEAGDTYIAGINDITGLGLNAQLENINATVTEAAKQVATTAHKIAAKTAAAAEEVGHTVTTSLRMAVGLAALAVVALFLLRRA
jgi:hypothetical protein